MEFKKQVREEFETGKKDTSIADYVIGEKISGKKLEKIAGKLDQDVKYLLIGFSWRFDKSERYREHVYAGACHVFEDKLVFEDPLFFDQALMESTLNRGFQLEKGHPVVEIPTIVYAYLLKKQ